MCPIRDDGKSKTCWKISVCLGVQVHLDFSIIFRKQQIQGKSYAKYTIVNNQ